MPCELLLLLLLLLLLIKLHLIHADLLGLVLKLNRRRVGLVVVVLLSLAALLRGSHQVFTLERVH